MNSARFWAFDLVVFEHNRRADLMPHCEYLDKPMILERLVLVMRSLNLQKQINHLPNLAKIKLPTVSCKNYSTVFANTTQRKLESRLTIKLG